MKPRYLYLILTLIFGCSSSSSENLDVIDSSGDPTSISILNDLIADQVSYYVDEDFANPTIEVWLFDAETDDALLCVDNDNGGMNAVITETVIYGNLEAAFDELIDDVTYEGELFRVKLYENASLDCSLEESDTFIGESPVVNYDSLISIPLIATNGHFYVRLKDDGDSDFPVPLTLSTTFSGTAFYVDQVSLDDDVNIGDEDNSPDLEIHIVDSSTNEMLACSGPDQGTAPVTIVGLTYGKILADLINSGDNEVDIDDNTGRTVKVIMADNDGDDCPSSLVSAGDDASSDDIIGESESLLWEDLPGSQVEMTNGAGSVTFTDIL